MGRGRDLGFNNKGRKVHISRGRPIMIISTAPNGIAQPYL